MNQLGEVGRVTPCPAFSALSESVVAAVGAQRTARPTLRFMESEDPRRRTLIVPMNLRDCDSSAAACSVAARDSGAFVPVGEIGSDTRQYDCLVTPARVFPLGRFAFSVCVLGVR